MAAAAATATTILLSSQPKSIQQLFRSPPPKNLHNNRHTTIFCRSTTGSSSSPLTEYDLYSLLGIDSSSNQSEIKTAYRSLQKRCHPDIAGPTGHDMAIVLNEAYSILSDPISKLSYDKEKAKFTEFEGYTGKPIYSTWVGSESENRAVFVDEVKCIGCLKCALLASNTFAIESIHGRARVVNQWADSEDKIVDAIEICPVNCISFVERSDLAALEFLMSKQPRGHVRLSGSNTAGVRVANVFEDIQKFQKRFMKMKENASSSSDENSKERDERRETRVTAMAGIRAMANWVNRQAPRYGGPATTGECTGLMFSTKPKPTREHDRSSTERLKQAAAEWRAGGGARRNALSNNSVEEQEEYWTPTPIFPSPTKTSKEKKTPSVSSSFTPKKEEEEENTVIVNVKEEHPLSVIIPIAFGIVSSMVVGGHGSRGNLGENGLTEHAGGNLALEMVNSSGMQILLTGITWYFVGAAVVGIIRLLGSKRD